MLELILTFSCEDGVVWFVESDVALFRALTLVSQLIETFLLINDQTDIVESS
jgi:hypothetical protein